MPQIPRLRPRNKGAFTLIELLVVIAIIAILAAILFPVFAQAREKARAITCTSNMKELGTAFLMYSQDFDEILPSPGGTSGANAAWDYLACTATSCTNTVLDPYLKNRNTSATSIWVCPDLNGGPINGNPNNYNDYPRTYAMNSLLRGPGNLAKAVSGCPSTVTDVDTLSVVAPSPGGAYGYTCTNQLPNGIGLGNIVEPAGTVLIFEAVPEVDTGTYNGSTFRTGDFTSAAGYALTAAQCKSNRGYTCQNSGYLPMHGGGMDNWLYCDGHVKSHQPIQAAYPFPNPIPATGNDYRLTEFLVTHCRSGSSICP